MQENFEYSAWNFHKRVDGCRSDTPWQMYKYDGEGAVGCKMLGASPNGKTRNEHFPDSVEKRMGKRGGWLVNCRKLVIAEEFLNFQRTYVMREGPKQGVNAKFEN